MDQLKNYLALLTGHPIAGTIGAMVTAIFSYLYGGTEFAIGAILIYAGAIALDWIAGYRASKRDGSYASEYGIDGGFRTAFLLIVPALAHRADVMMNLPNVIFAFVLFSFGLHIWKSMTANVVRCGWDVWIPIWALDYVADEIEHKIARSQKRIDEKQKYLKKDDE